jgi:hypothetical protein
MPPLGPRPPGAARAAVVPNPLRDFGALFTSSAGGGSAALPGEVSAMVENPLFGGAAEREGGAGSALARAARALQRPAHNDPPL